MFSRDVWNCFGSQDRTTNVCEGYHSALNEQFKHRSPDPYKFIKFLQEQDQQIERRLAQLQLGAPPKKRKSKNVLVDDAIARLQDQFFANAIPGLNRLLQYIDSIFNFQVLFWAWPVALRGLE